MVWVVILIFIFLIIILALSFDIKLKDIKYIKEVNFDEDNIKLVENLPSNIEICKEILKELGNNPTSIEECKDSKDNTSIYLFCEDKISIANINQSFTRIQTVIHECVHSIQNKRILLANVIMSNISNLYFILLLVLLIIGKLPKDIDVVMFGSYVIVQFISYAIRSFLEMDAMTRAEYLTDQYLNNNENKKEIVGKYKELNKVGIKLYNFILICKMIGKICINLLVLVM